MPNLKLNRNNFTLQLRRGAAANLWLNATVYTLHAGEPLWTTDTHQFYVSDGTTLYLIPSLNDALTYEDDVLTYEGDVLYA
jgi:hypothetical protein